MIYVVATLKIELGTLEPFVEAAIPCIAATRNEAGCISYELAASLTDPERVTFIEQWSTREALEAHFATPHMAKFSAASKSFVKATKVEIIHSEKVELV